MTRGQVRLRWRWRAPADSWIAAIWNCSHDPHRQVHAFRDFVAVIEAFGFRKARSRGSHQSFVHADCPRLLVIQPKGKDANNTKCANSLI
jgi:predicted RNA binding protein YcfA (HicA-like mRNA interferase family)